MAHYGFPNWMSAISTAMESLCVSLKETTPPYILCDIATKAMADGIFECAKKSPGFDLQLEDCKCPELLLPDVSHCRAAGWDYRQFTNKGRHKHLVMHQLREVFSRFNRHLLYQAKRVVVNQDIFGSPSHPNGIYSINALPSTELANWWCTFSDDYGFGIFHSVKQDEVMREYTMVK